MINVLIKFEWLFHETFRLGGRAPSAARVHRTPPRESPLPLRSSSSLKNNNAVDEQLLPPSVLHNHNQNKNSNNNSNDSSRNRANSKGRRASKSRSPILDKPGDIDDISLVSRIIFILFRRHHRLMFVVIMVVQWNSLRMVLFVKCNLAVKC